MDIIENLKCVITPITVGYSSNCSERNSYSLKDMWKNFFIK